MFCLNDTMRYFLCPGKTDMRKGINSLCGVVHDRMGHDVRLGDVFIFINRSRTTMKLLHAEDGGMVLYVKRLEEGTFRLPAYDSRSRSYPMEWRDLVMMVEGISDNPNERLKRLKASRKVSIRSTTGIKPLYTTIATVTMNLIVSAAIVLLNPYVTVYISYKIPPFALSVHIPDVSTSIYVEVDSKVLLGLPFCDKASGRLHHSGTPLGLHRVPYR